MMKILIAEDDPVSRLLLETTLGRWGYEPVVTTNGREALHAMQRPDAPAMAILDWMMPELDGVQTCQEIRALLDGALKYLVLLTAKGTTEDVVAGLDAGADDYLVKPFNRAELKARIRVGVRVVGLQHSLADRVRELEAAQKHVKHLQGILPICCYCKKIRDGANYWQQVESYIAENSDAQFSHSFCPDCYEQILKPDLAKTQDG